MNKESLLRRAFDFSAHVSGSSIADQTRGSGSQRQEAFESSLDAVIDLRIRLGRLRIGSSQHYELVRLKYGLEKSNDEIMEILNVQTLDIQEMIHGVFPYLFEETEVMPKTHMTFTQPERKLLSIGDSVLVLEGELSGEVGQVVRFEGDLYDRVIIRYFANGKEVMSFQNSSYLEWS